MLLEEIVKEFGQQAGMRVGVLVEYPRSKCCEEVLGTFLGRRDGCRGPEYKGGAEYKVRAASVVLLIEEQEHCKSKKFSAFKIDWGKGTRSVNRTVDGCHFDIQNKKIEVCELRDGSQIVKGQVSNFFVLNLSEQSPSMPELVAYAADIERKLIEFNVKIENLKFLATCDDLKWLYVCDPKHVPEPLNQYVKSIQQEKVELKIASIDTKIVFTKSKLKSLENDLLEAQDRLHPCRRWVKKLLGIPIIGEIIRLGLGIYAFSISILIYVFRITIYGDFAFSPGADAAISSGVVFLLVIAIGTVGHYKKLSRWIDKFSTMNSRIEESRKRQAEKLYENRKNS